VYSVWERSDLSVYSVVKKEGENKKGRGIRGSAVRD
jgi:hypothetical protein